MSQIKFTSELKVDLVEGMQMGSDKMIAAAAWVSTAADALERADKNPDDVPGVINYLVKHRHGTPFEHGSFTVNCRLPIFVWREWHRHRIGMSYNEESGRYKQLAPEFYMPPAHRPMFKPDGEWKAGRPKFITVNESENQNLAGDIYGRFCESYKRDCALVYETYEKNLDFAFDPGMARIMLPVGIMSSCWVTLNPRSCMSFLSLRVHDLNAKFVSYPLWEIDQAARILEEIFKQYWPITHAAFVKNGRVAP